MTNFCKDCMYYRLGEPGTAPKCYHSSAIMEVNLVTGITYYNTCQSIRNNVNKCGPEGRYFEKQIKESLWYKLFWNK